MREWNPFCDVCHRRKSYSGKYDAYFCKSCDEWKEKKMNCGDLACQFCILERPPKPSQDDKKKHLWDF